MEVFSQIFQTYIVQIGLFLIMAGLGLTLSIKDLLEAITTPKAVIIGLVGQMILLPLLAFGLAFIFKPSPFIAIGLILLAACPGGITSNGYVLVSRGDVALSVTLTTISSLLTVITMPLLAYLAFATFSEGASDLNVPTNNLMVSLAKLTVLPIVGGMILHWKFPAFAEKMKEPVRIMAFAILVMVIVGNTVTSFDTLKHNIVAAGLLAAVLNITALAMGYALSKLFKLSNEKTISITFEVGIQNLSLVLTLAMAILKIPDYAAFALVYALFMKVTSIGFTAYSLKWLVPKSSDKSKEGQAITASGVVK